MVKQTTQLLILGTVLLLALALGCLGEPEPTPSPTPTSTPEPVYDVEKALAELAAARTLWESRGSDDYTVRYEAFLGLAFVPTRLTVKDGVIVSAEYLTRLEYGEPVRPYDMNYLRTIDGLFDEIKDALSGRPAWSMSAEYDPDYGYPRDFGASFTKTPDDYFSGGFDMYQPLAPPTATPTHTPVPPPTPTPSPTPDDPLLYAGYPGTSCNADRTTCLHKHPAFSCGPFLGHMEESSPNVLLWTPEGSNLIFSQGGIIWEVDEQGAELRMVLDANAKYLTSFATSSVLVDFFFGFHASLSPDGARLAYTSCQFPTEPEDPAIAQHILAQDGPEWYERTLYYYEIALAEIDGGSQQRITHNRIDDHYPVWSPDGDRIAFVQGVFGGRLTTTSPDGSDVYYLTPRLALGSVDVARVPPVWSPDGQRLAFVMNEGVGYLRERRNVYTVRTDGSELVRVGEMGGLDFAHSRLTAAPTWSPDGERLAFQGSIGEELAIYTVQFDGSDLRLVWQSGGDIKPDGASQVSWSPDGTELLVVGDRGVYILPLDGGSLRQLLHSTGWRFTVAAWSPDGSRVAVYSSNAWWTDPEGRAAALYVVNRDGTALRTVVTTDHDGNFVVQGIARRR